MFKRVWLIIITLSVFVGTIEGRLGEVAVAGIYAVKFAFGIAFGLTGIMVLWLGIMEIAKQSGIINMLARYLRPIMIKLFPDIPKEDPAMGAIILNIAANMIGLGNAATPFGIQAMKELQRLNHNSNIASDSMCIFLALNTSSIQLIPATAIALLVANGSNNPTSVIFSSLIASSISTIVAIFVVKQLAKLPLYRTKYVSDV